MPDATYTFDIFMTLDGFGGHTGDWGGYWGKQGPEFLAHRAAAYADTARMVFGAGSFRDNIEFLADLDDEQLGDEWLVRLRQLPATVISSTLAGPFAWPDATVESGDAVEIVRRLKAESDGPVRSHGSLTLNRALIDAGVVDEIQVTVFPVLCGRTGALPVFAGVGDFDLELVAARTFDHDTQVLTYRPTRH
jgi:dihydrofolate reductase